MLGCGEVHIRDVATSCIDQDGDGFGDNCPAGDDCDDFDPTIPGPETCGSGDEDCDGAYDEGLEGGPCPLDPCQGQWRCVDRQRVCRSTVPGDPCNGVDDDCDGTVDESDYTGGRCLSGEVGRCAAGRMACEEGVFGCAPLIRPATVPERCDAVDDDCDGRVDEDVPQPPCYDGPPGTEGVGACHAGRRLCEVGRYVTCAGAVTPHPERCDGVDDDCDGIIDEGLDCGCLDGETRACPPRPPAIEGVAGCAAGVQPCVDGRWGLCEGLIDPRPEICDGVDDDCDGALDEQAVGLDLPCAAGRGECRASGVLICQGARLRCDAEPKQAAESDECFGTDADCDGAVGIPHAVGDACMLGDDPGIRLCYGGLSCVVDY